MAGGEPEFRANWSKLVLRWVRGLPERDLVLATIGQDAVDTVHQAGVFEWLPATVHMHLTDSIRQALGDDARRFWRELMHASLSRSLLKPLLDGGLRLF